LKKEKSEEIVLEPTDIAMDEVKPSEESKEKPKDDNQKDN